MTWQVKLTQLMLLFITSSRTVNFKKSQTDYSGLHFTVSTPLKFLRTIIFIKKKDPSEACDKIATTFATHQENTLQTNNKKDPSKQHSKDHK